MAHLHERARARARRTLVRQSLARMRVRFYLLRQHMSNRTRSCAYSQSIAARADRRVVCANQSNDHAHIRHAEGGIQVQYI
jgi:hypothetical protein